MGLRSSGRKLSFDILSEAASLEDAADSRLFRRSNSLPTHHHTEVPMPKDRKRKKHKKKKKQSSPDFAVISEDPVSDSNAESAASGVVFENRSDANCQSYVRSVRASSTITVVASENGYNNNLNSGGELRQRNVAGNDEAESREEEISMDKQQQRSSEANGSVVTKLETVGSLDWKQLMAEDPNCK